MSNIILQEYTNTGILIDMLPDVTEDCGLIDAVSLAVILDSHYREPYRAYHNIDHLATMMMNLLKYPVEDVIPEIPVAILFHDIVYELNAPSGQNEERSAEIATRMGKYCFTDIDWKLVSDLILATKHQTEPITTSEKIIVDLDCCTFACKWTDFVAVNTKIVEEYESIYPPKQVLQGRLQFLTEFFKRKQIFFTDVFSETQARRNISDLVEHLTMVLSL